MKILREMRPSRVVSILIALLIFAGLIITMVFINQPDPSIPPSSARKLMFAHARVVRVTADDSKPDFERAEGRRVGKQELEVELLDGPYKGELLPLTNYLSALANVYVKAGTRVVVQINTGEDGNRYATMQNYERGLVMGFFVLFFMILMCVIGGKKGFKALLGLIFTLACLWFLLIPLMMKGYPTIPLTIGVVAITAIATLLLIDGFTKKVFAASAGCIAGVASAGLVAALVGVITPLNGFNMNDAESLILQVTDDGMEISGLLICGILISALGAVIDVAMSIASSVNELQSLNPDLSKRRLFQSGMNIGKDMMGTMANTLILAFVGSSLNMLILVRAYDIPFIQLINTDFIVIEVLQGVSGSIGIVLTVPFVAAISAYVYRKRSRLPGAAEEKKVKGE